MALQDNLKDARTRVGMSQELVAEQLGVSRQAVTKWELGQSKPSAKNLKALADLYQIPPEELLKAANREGPNLILRANLTKIAIMGQAVFLNSAAHHLYMLRSDPTEKGYQWAFLLSLLALLPFSTWMAFCHRFEEDKAQRRKNTKIEWIYCSIQALVGFLMIYFGIGFIGTALIIVICLCYILYINPKYMNRKLTK